MALHIHIHKPTRDAGWDESKHPRKDDGKFGSGGGKKAAPELRHTGTPGTKQAITVDPERRLKSLRDLQAAKPSKEREATIAALEKEVHARNAPLAPDHLPGPKSKAAIAQIKALAAKGDWRGIANVQTMGTHPLVTAYRDKMAAHLESGGKALTEALGGKK